MTQGAPKGKAWQRIGNLDRSWRGTGRDDGPPWLYGQLIGSATRLGPRTSLARPARLIPEGPQVRVGPDGGVGGEQGQPVVAGRGDDHPVSGVGVEAARQGAAVHRDGRQQR